MANLTNIAAIIRKFVIPLSVIALIIFLGFLIYFRFFKTQEITSLLPINKPVYETLPPQTTQFDTSQLKLPEITPQKLEVYKIISETNLLQNSDSISQKLGFNQKPEQLDDAKFGKTLLYSESQATFLIRQETITYLNNAQFYQVKLLLLQKADSANIFDLQNQALNLLSSLGLSVNSLAEPSITFSKKVNNETASTTNIQEADFINFQYQYLLSTIPIIIPTSPISITVNKQGDLIYLSYRLLGETSVLSRYPVIEGEEALKTLLDGNGSLIQIQEPEETSMASLEKIGPVTLIRAYLAYYLPTKTPEILQPVWIFEGETSTQDRTTQLTYAVTAITEDLLNQP